MPSAIVSFSSEYVISTIARTTFWSVSLTPTSRTKSTSIFR